MKVGLFIVLFAVIVIIVRAFTSYFECPKCKGAFRVSLLSYILAPHFMGKRKIKCPHCGNTEYLTSKWGNKSH